MEKYTSLVSNKEMASDVEIVDASLLDSFVGRDAKIVSGNYKGMDHSFVKRNALIRSNNDAMCYSYVGGSAEIHSRRNGLDQSIIQNDAKIEADIGLKDSFIGGKAVISAKSSGLVRSFVRNYVGKLECEEDVLCGSPFNLIAGKVKGRDLNSAWYSMLITSLFISHDIQLKYLFNINPNCNVIVPSKLPKGQMREGFIVYTGDFIELINYVRTHSREFTGLRCLKLNEVSKISSLDELLEINTALEERLGTSSIDYASLMMYEYLSSCYADYRATLSGFFKVGLIETEDDLIRMIKGHKILEEFAPELPFIREIRQEFFKKYIKMKEQGLDDNEIRVKLSAFCSALKQEPLQKWLSKSKNYIGPML